jgi:flagellar motor switch protein FliN/FliY
MTLPNNIATLAHMPVEMEGRLDRRSITMRELLELAPGSLVRLDKSAGENIDVLAGGALLGYGEVVVVESVIGIRIMDFREEQ